MIGICVDQYGATVMNKVVTPAAGELPSVTTYSNMETDVARLPGLVS